MLVLMPAPSLHRWLDHFKAMANQGTSVYKPAYGDLYRVHTRLIVEERPGQKLWDEFVEVVSARDNLNGSEENEMRIDERRSVWVSTCSSRLERTYWEGLASTRRARQEGHLASSVAPWLSATKWVFQVHPIHALITFLLRIRRPDAIFYTCHLCIRLPH